METKSKRCVECFTRCDCAPSTLLRPALLYLGEKNPVAVIQLASTERIVVLHISKWAESGEDRTAALYSLGRILITSQFKKVGVTLAGKEDQITPILPIPSYAHI